MAPNAQDRPLAPGFGRPDPFACQNASRCVGSKAVSATSAAGCRSLWRSPQLVARVGIKQVRGQGAKTLHLGVATALVLDAGQHLSRSVKIAVLGNWNGPSPNAMRNIRHSDRDFRCPATSHHWRLGRERVGHEVGRRCANRNRDDEGSSGLSRCRQRPIAVSYCPLRRSLILATESWTSEKTAVVPSPVGD